MRRVTAVAVLVASAAVQGGEPDAELKALQGTWVAVSEELNGVATPKEKLVS